ncbi:hypothetical protein A8990_1802 [Paenibacillus taihuensis]|uniref:Antitoxin VbhA domain-containing protein n=1 Tax=Paenibacillus taihuensis TaxID=1156355 RepID=A0A3D9PW36_9BACL|nr:hypothetical protein [Paenibacillus taihuensis]REE54715.1 hypothetical protein A8990_1802 [Paenibacillus taihuensis]
MNMSKGEFDRHFQTLQASWGFEGQELQKDEQEMLRRVCMGEISKEDYFRWIQNHVVGRDRK